MTELQQLLEDVLAGRKTVSDTFTFNELRRIAGRNETEQLNHLESEARAKRAEPTITAVERIRRELAQPEGAQPKTPATPTDIKLEIKLTRADAEDFCNERRVPSMVEIEWLLQHAPDYELRLTTLEVEILRNLASRLAPLARAAKAGRPYNPADEFLRTLGVLETGVGHLERAEVAQLRGIYFMAAQAIQDCAHHSQERCGCWRAARDELFNLRSRVGEQSAMGMAALRVWDQLDELSASRSTQPEQRQTRDRIGERGWQPWKSWGWHNHRPGYYEERAAYQIPNVPVQPIPNQRSK